MRLTASVVLLVGLNSGALASGGISCTADDGKVAFDVSGGVTSGMGGPLFSFDGTVTIKDQAVAEDLRKTSLGLEHVAQYWLDGEELRLGLYRERDADKPHGYVAATIRTRSAEEGSFEGTYEASTFDIIEGQSEAKSTQYSGKVSCFSE